MPIVHACAAEDCDTLTMGDLCLACEQKPEAIFGENERLDPQAARARTPYAAIVTTSRTSTIAA